MKIFRNRIMFNRSAPVDVQIVTLPKKNTNIVPMVFITILLTLSICIAIDYTPQKSKDTIRQSKVVVFFQKGLNNANKKISKIKKSIRTFKHSQRKNS